MGHQDIELKCVCQDTFLWTVGKQKFMKRLLEEGKIQKVTEPKRCPECREKRKAKQEKQATRPPQSY